MLDTAAMPLSNLDTPNNFDTAQPGNSGDQSHLDQAIDEFKKTGRVDNSIVEYAKTEVLPKRGLSKAQIDDLGPVGVMVKLTEKPDAEKPIVKQSTPPAPLERKAEETLNPKLDVNAENFNDISSELAKMTDNLTNEIDKEIKKQMEERKSLVNAQQSVDKVIEEHEKIKIPEPKISTEEPKPPSPEPKIGLFKNKVEHNFEQSVKPKLSQPINKLVSEEHDSDENVSVDPLTASVTNAINSLKEGDKIGDEWILQKILTTSFGNKKSPFYELTNKSGAAWTLSFEEMKDIIRSDILSHNAPPVHEIKSVKPAPLHQIDFDQNETKVKEPEKKPTDQDRDRDNKHAEKTVFVRESDDKPRERLQENEHYRGTKPQQNQKIHHEEPKHKPIERTTPTPQTEAKTVQEKYVESTQPQNETKLTKNQIDFLNKIHSDQTLWSVFTSFNPNLWNYFHDLYESGKLIDIGIDAHPLFDKLENSDFGQMIDIHKGSTAIKLFEEAGYNLTWTKEDADIFAVHIIANHKLLAYSLQKVEVSGLSVPELPSSKEVIELCVAAKNGNNESLYKLQEPLNYLPVNNKFKVIKPIDLEPLKRYFKL